MFKEQQKRFSRVLPMILCIWFFIGMLLSMTASGLATLLSFPLPPAFFFLSSLAYLSGGLLGGVWSRDHLRQRKRFSAETGIILLVLLMSSGFLLCAILFLLLGFRHL